LSNGSVYSLFNSTNADCQMVLSILYSIVHFTDEKLICLYIIYCVQIV